MNAPLTMPMLPNILVQKMEGPLKQLGDFSSFLTFSQFTRCCQLELVSKSLGHGKDRHLYLLCTDPVALFRHFEIEADLAEWVRKWDKINYGKPLTPRQKAFLVARSYWLRLSGYAHDLPFFRWRIFTEVVCRLGDERSRRVMASCFDSTSETSKTVSSAVRRAGLAAPDLQLVLGPYSGS